MPGVSNTCEATGPVAVLRLLTPALLPALHVAPPAGSPKFQRYSRSWNGRVVVEAVVPAASKNTANGATPIKRLGTLESVMALVFPVVEQPVGMIAGVAVDPPPPLHATRPITANSAAKRTPGRDLEPAAFWFGIFFSNPIRESAGRINPSFLEEPPTRNRPIATNPWDNSGTLGGRQ